MIYRLEVGREASPIHGPKMPHVSLSDTHTHKNGYVLVLDETVTLTALQVSEVHDSLFGQTEGNYHILILDKEVQPDVFTSMKLMSYHVNDER